jgi:hypothetical protein
MTCAPFGSAIRRRRQFSRNFPKGNFPEKKEKNKIKKSIAISQKNNCAGIPKINQKIFRFFK